MIWLRFEPVTTRLISTKKFIAYYFHVVWPPGVLWPITFFPHLWIKIHLLGCKLDILGFVLIYYLYYLALYWVCNDPVNFNQQYGIYCFESPIYIYACPIWIAFWVIQITPIYAPKPIQIIHDLSELPIYTCKRHLNHTYINTYVYSNHPQPYIYAYMIRTTRICINTWSE